MHSSAEIDAWREGIATACDRLPCWMQRGHEGPCEPGSRLDPRRDIPSAKTSIDATEETER